MFSKSFKFVAGAVALALTGQVFAATTASVGTDSTIFLTVNDTTTGAGYVFDTGLSVTGFNQNQNQSFTLNDASGSAYNQFLTSVGANDNLEYAVIGGEEPSAGTAPATVDVTGVATPGLKTYAGIAVSYTNVNNFLTTVANPAGADSYQTASGGTGWYANGEESNVDSALHDTDFNSEGSSLNFYQLVAAGLSGHTNGALTTLAGTWDFNGATLTYTSSAPTVPLPAPLGLLLSGLGLMSVITRRRRNAAEAN